jgi:hypothetical protein
MLRWLWEDAFMRPLMPSAFPSFRSCPFALNRYTARILPSLHATLSKALMLLVVWSAAALESLAASLPIHSEVLTSGRSSMAAAPPCLLLRSTRHQAACQPGEVCAPLRWVGGVRALPIDDHLVPPLHLLRTVGLELHILRSVSPETPYWLCVCLSVRHTLPYVLKTFITNRLI